MILANAWCGQSALKAMPPTGFHPSLNNLPTCSSSWVSPSGPLTTLYSVLFMCKSIVIIHLNSSRNGTNKLPRRSVCWWVALMQLCLRQWFSAYECSLLRIQVEYTALERHYFV